MIHPTAIAELMYMRIENLVGDNSDYGNKQNPSAEKGCYFINITFHTTMALVLFIVKFEYAAKLTRRSKRWNT